jgi:predicted DNA-binding protein with PD1-like motif
VEVLSLTGNITRTEEEYKVHAHAVLGKSDASGIGGHVLEADVWPTLEVIVEESPKHLLRQIDPETGLPLLELRNE